MAEIAAGGGEGFGQLGRLNLAGRLEKESREDKSFKEAKTVGREDTRGERLKAARCAINCEHRALAEECVDAHGEYS